MPPLAINSHRALKALADAPNGLSRQELADSLGVSRPTIQGVVKHLKADGWIDEYKPNGTDPQDGRRVAATFRLGARAGLVAGADIGHRHVHVAIADANGTILASARTPDVSQDSVAADVPILDIDMAGPAVLRTMARMLDRCLHQAGRDIKEVRGFAIGIPAPLRLDGRLASSLFLPGWTTVNVGVETRAALDEVFPDDISAHVEIFVENDANLGAHAERRRRGPGCRNLGYVKLSTGVGMGLLLNGTVYRGQTGVAAEFGHVSVPAEALVRTGIAEPENLPRPCPRCQKPDCVEVLVGADQLVAWLQRQDPGYSEAVTIENVIDNVLTSKLKHPKCLQAIVNAGTWVGFALADQLTMLDLEVVVIGGLLARAGDVLLEPLEAAIAVHSVGLSTTRLSLIEGPIQTVELEGAIALALAETSLALVV